MIVELKRYEWENPIEQCRDVDPSVAILEETKWLEVKKFDRKTGMLIRKLCRSPFYEEKKMQVVDSSWEVVQNIGQNLIVWFVGVQQQKSIVHLSSTQLTKNNVANVSWVLNLVANLLKFKLKLAFLAQALDGLSFLL